MRFPIIPSAAILATLLAGPAAMAATINVTTSDNLNTEIGNATAGDTLVLADGTYNQDVTITKSITLQAQNVGAAIITSTNPIAGVRVQADGVVLNGITISGCDFAGLSVEVPATLTLTDASISNNGVNGAINNDSGSGVFVASGTGAVTLNTTSCTFDGNGGRGLTLQGGGNTYNWSDSGSSIDGNGEVGILLDGATVVDFDGTSFSNNTTSGFVSFFALTGTIDNAAFDGNGNRGLELLPTENQVNDLDITATSFSGNGSQGFILDQAGGAARPGQQIDMVNCTLDGNGGANPSFFTGGNYTITGGSITNNAEGLARFFWEDASGTTIDLDGVTITGNTGFGVRVDVPELTAVTVNDCVITGNGGEGSIQHFGGSAGHTLDVTNSTLGIGTGSVACIFFQGQGTLTATNVIMDATAASAAAESRAIALVSNGGGVATGTINHCTMVGPGMGDADFRAIELKNDPSAVAQASGADTVGTVTNSIFVNWGTGIQLFDDADGAGNEAAPVYNGDNNLFFDVASVEGPDDDSDAAGGPEGGTFNRTDAITGDPVLDVDYEPLASSAAVNAADASSTLTEDRYGNARPGGAGNDVGAVEATTAIRGWSAY